MEAQSVHPPNDKFIGDDEEFVSRKKFARLAGISVSTVIRLQARELLPTVQPGGHRCRVLIPLSALTTLLTDALSATEEDVLPAPNESVKARIPGPAPRWQKTSVTQPNLIAYAQKTSK